ncbi:DNA-directed RNA polymerase III subunit RPC4-like isoform X2 [Momordica charantia]|uniref:DNA-directed RNA polymerase III subunit RPC4-like isoform X2 n=1 Tax=Momordica charantia TaxID=3673 RepID=A0A6J1CHV0_MOMCH|nr:DNA-directed RNA polymerase III subunit RPC4-like isoform X2 [Momordica charantia]
MKNPDPSSRPRRKVKFAPKPTPRKRPPPAPKPEDEDGNQNAAQTRYLLRRATENLGKRGTKVEKKPSVQVAFGPGAASASSSIRTYGVPKVGNSSRKNNIEPEISDDEESILPLPVDVEEDGMIFDQKSEDGTPESAMATNAVVLTKAKKDYREPWDYHHSYYPNTLPLRKPYSGHPELLDKAEFGLDAPDREYDENAAIPALDLELLEEKEEKTMYFFQLPACLPLPKQSSTATRKEKVGSSRSSNSKGTSELGDLKKLPGGYMGKLLIYKSGAVKLRLGETLYDVSSGSNCSFLQHVVAINTEEGHCCDLGDVGKRVVVTPDISSLLNAVTD